MTEMPFPLMKGWQDSKKLKKARMVELTWAPELVSHAQQLANEYPELANDVQILKNELESGRVSGNRIPGVSVGSAFVWQRDQTSAPADIQRDFHLLIIEWRHNKYYIADICEGGNCDEYFSAKCRKLLRSLRIGSLRPSS